MLADSPVGAYAVKQTNGQLELLGDIYESAPYGYVVKKDQAAFAEVLKDAVAGGHRRRHLQGGAARSGASTAAPSPPPSSTRQSDHVGRDRNTRTGTAGTDPGRARPAPRTLGRGRRDRRADGDVRAPAGHEQGVQLVVHGRRDVPPADHRGAARHHRADRDLHGDRYRARHRDRGHAAVGEPDPARRLLGRTPGSSGRCPGWCWRSSSATWASSGPGSSSGCPSTGRSAPSSASQNFEARLFGFTAVEILTGFVAGMLALALSEAAYMAEIVRAGIQSVDEGQTEAAAGAGHEPGADPAPDRAAAGHAGDRPADRQRDHRDAQGHLAGGLRAGHRRSCSSS